MYVCVYVCNKNVCPGKKKKKKNQINQQQTILHGVIF